MLEQFWSKIWYKMLDGIAISHKTIPHSKIEFIELVKDCVTFHSNKEHFTLSLSDSEEPILVDSISLPNIAGLFEKNKKPSFQEALPFTQKVNREENIIKCKETHHQHYTVPGENIIQKESVRCLLEKKFEIFNNILNTTIINPNDINTIIQEYEKQHLAMKQKVICGNVINDANVSCSLQSGGAKPK